MILWFCDPRRTPSLDDEGICAVRWVAETFCLPLSLKERKEEVNSVSWPSTTFFTNIVWHEFSKLIWEVQEQFCGNMVTLIKCYLQSCISFLPPVVPYPQSCNGAVPAWFRIVPGPWVGPARWRAHQWALSELFSHLLHLLMKLHM